MKQAGAGFSITLDDAEWKEVEAAIGRLELGLRLELSRFIGEELLSIAQDSFEKEQSPAGVSWAPWSDWYREFGQHGAKKLDRRGDLFGSLVYEAMPEMVIVGSTMVYAPTHQFGAKKGEFGKTKRGAPIPWGDIPARPFLGITEEFSDRILGDPAVLELLGVR